ncbi:13960_t:CDS:2 [Ambispora leptoticha]|uniref:13960_t:CDS:1 n=1 Tax=Ambispora leptoticha TaxID=144679 RepID=A0A9N9FB64_9GLOM|nr:13960_t:CDS:2 [Ambispora leptoticha]
MNWSSFKQYLEENILNEITESQSYIKNYFLKDKIKNKYSLGDESDKKLLNALTNLIDSIDNSEDHHPLPKFSTERVGLDGTNKEVIDASTFKILESIYNDFIRPNKLAESLDEEQIIKFIAADYAKLSEEDKIELQKQQSLASQFLGLIKEEEQRRQQKSSTFIDFLRQNNVTVEFHILDPLGFFTLVDELGKEFRKFEKDGRKITEIQESLNGQLTSLRTEKEREITELKNKGSADQTRISQLEKEIKDLEETQTNLSRINDQSRKQISDLQTELNEIKSQKTELENKLQDHETNLINTKRLLDQKNSELNREISEVEKQKKLLSEKEQELIDQKEISQQNSEEIKQKESEINDLKNVLSTKDRELNTKNDELSYSSQILVDLNEEKEQLDQELRITQKKIKQLEQKISDLKCSSDQETKNLKSQINQLNKAQKDLQIRLDNEIQKNKDLQSKAGLYYLSNQTSISNPEEIPDKQPLPQLTPQEQIIIKLSNIHDSLDFKREFNSLIEKWKQEQPVPESTLSEIKKQILTQLDI